MTRHLHLTLGVLVATSLFAAALGCTSHPKLFDAWKAPDSGGKHYNKVMVLAVTHGPTMRRLLEDGLVARLTANRVSAVASHQLLPSDEKLAMPELAVAVKGQGCGAVLTIHEVAAERPQDAAPGYVTIPPPAIDGGFQQYYDDTWEAFHTAERVPKRSMVRLDTRLFDSSEGRLIWTGLTVKSPPEDVARDVGAMTNTIVLELKARGLL